MASCPQVANVEDKDCFAKRNVPTNICALSDSSNLLSSKKIKLEEPLLTSHEVEYASEDDPDEWGGSLAMAIDERLSTLQHLLPQGPKMEDDEVLRVLIEYVKELESEIKMFNSTSIVNGCDKLDQIIETSPSPLQRRGLCIVPLSTLAKAL